jgi:hypothetical protein
MIDKTRIFDLYEFFCIIILIVFLGEEINYEECNYIEWWNGHNIEQFEITDEIIDLERIEPNLKEIEENKALFGQYDLYKDQEGNLYLHWLSYYKGNLGEVEEITEQELQERFNYKL